MNFTYFLFLVGLKEPMSFSGNGLSFYVSDDGKYFEFFYLDVILFRYPLNSVKKITRCDGNKLDVLYDSVVPFPEVAYEL